MSEALNCGVFISYSRNDSAFVDRLQVALKERGVDARVDRQDIEKGEEWWARIQQLITEADTIIFALSPDSVASPICQAEVDFGESISKRFVPVVVKDLGSTPVPAALARLNYLFFGSSSGAQPPREFASSVDELVRVLDTDIGWIREHTRLGTVAARWESRNYANELLLRGAELKSAERWITSRPTKAPNPSDAHRHYLTASRRAATVRQRWWTAGSITLAVCASALAGFAIHQRIDAEQNRSAAVLQQERAEASETETKRIAGSSDFVRGANLLLRPDSTSEGVALLARSARQSNDPRAFTRLWTLLQQRQFWVAAKEFRATPNRDERQVGENNTIQKLESAGKSISANEDGRFVFTATFDVSDGARYRVWNSDGSPKTDWLEPADTGGNRIDKLDGRLSPNGEVLALIVGHWRERSRIQLIDLGTKKAIGQPILSDGQWPREQHAGFSTVAFIRGADDATFLITGSEKGNAEVRKVGEESIEVLTQNQHAEPILLAKVDENRQWLMSAAADGTIMISRIDSGESVGNIVRSARVPESINRTMENAFSIGFEDGSTQEYTLHGPWKFELSKDSSHSDSDRPCKLWDPVGLDDVETRSTGAINDGAWRIRDWTYTLKNRQIEYQQAEGASGKSPVLQSDVVLTCLSEGNLLSVTDKRFDTQVWSTDFSKRFGVVVSEREAISPKTAPETTNLTVASQTAGILLIRSHTTGSPDYGTLWYSAWDMGTGVPLIDRVGTGNDLVPFVAISFRLSPGGEEIVFAEGLHSIDGKPVSSLQLTPPATTTLWLTDFVEALVDTRMSDAGILESVADPEGKRARGFEELGKLSVLRAR